MSCSSPVFEVELLLGYVRKNINVHPIQQRYIYTYIKIYTMCGGFRRTRCHLWEVVEYLNIIIYMHTQYILCVQNVLKFDFRSNILYYITIRFTVYEKFND
jgi:hypothetical protein